MHLPPREELIALAKADPEAIVDQLIMLRDQVVALEKRLAELERNSRTSSKPPSSDKGNFTNKPKPKSLRKKSGRKPGGQKGHPGSTLEKVTHPDHIERHDFSPDAACPDCGHALADSLLENPGDTYETRQVFDIPPIKPVVTEHRAPKCPCAGCGKTLVASFPETVTAPVQYGPRVQAAALYLGSYQLLPYQRLSELFGELFHCPLSQGTLANIIKRSAPKAVTAMEPVRESLIQSPVVHADETGCTLHGKLNWLHVFSTDRLTCYHLDPKRGREAMERMDLLPHFQNLLIHDCLGAYFTFTDCRHGLCNAHTQRELTYLHEQQEQEWAGEMIDLLLEAKDLADRELAREESDRRIIGQGRLKKILTWYDEVLRSGYLENPEPPPKPKGQRGRVKRGKALNLLDRFDKKREEIMGYFLYPGLYPYDNNQAERDVRPVKVREKISGTFRSEEHGRGFCGIRSIISSTRKQGRPILEALSEMISSPAALGMSLTQGT